MDSAQFLGADIISLYKSKKPFFLEEFTTYAYKLGVKKIKYQLLGPITFYDLNLDDQITYESFVDLHKKILRDLEIDFDVLYVLDEPCLGKNEVQDVQMLKELYQELKEISSLGVYVHCCNKLDLALIKNLNEIDLNLDISLYENKTLPESCLRFQGLKSGHKTLGSSPQIEYIAPSCGLALNHAEELQEILKNLNSIKSASHLVV